MRYKKKHASIYSKHVFLYFWEFSYSKFRRIYAFKFNQGRQEISNNLLQRRKVDMEKDVSWKEYFRDDERYADVINGIGCGGLQLVAE